MKKIDEIINSRFIENVFPSKEALKKLLEKRGKLNIYLGVDPTGPQLHLGHSTNFLLLKKFQELNHNVIFLIGDFTAMIGDPTGKSKARKPLTKKEILKNLKGYKRQASKIIKTDKKSLKIKFNSQWYSKIKFEEMIRVMSKITYGQLIKRKMFQERINEGREIYLHELIYPILQGYDSVKLETDIEIGGNDQTFNMLIGRDLVKEYLGKEKIVIATRLLENPKTGKKMMSKSEGNFIALNDPAEEMFGKVMALPDEAILPIYKLCTEESDQKVKEIENRLKNENPRNIKFELAKKITLIYHGKEKSEKAANEFEKIFKKKEKPDAIPEVKFNSRDLILLEVIYQSGLVNSKSEAKRLIEEGAVKLNNRIMSDWRENIKLEGGEIIQIGKRKFAKVKI